MRTLYFYLLASLLLIVNSCGVDRDDELDKILEQGEEFNEEKEITSDSDLFNYLEEITTDETRADLNITCIDFEYPLFIFVFDENNEFISTNSIESDIAFNTFLIGLNEEYSISISFPITTILESGEEFTVNNKEELQEVISNCLLNEQVNDCNQLLENCLWKVGYTYNGDNPFLGGIFQESNGFTTFYFDDTLIAGSWTALSIDGELHININLIEEGDRADYFNNDWTVEYLDENSLLLKHNEKELVINQRCDEDFLLCENFTFESCENEEGTEVSDFIFEDYKFCILETLELNENSDISFYENLEDAQNSINALPDDIVYNNVTQFQKIFVRIDVDSQESYYVEIELVSVTC